MILWLNKMKRLIFIFSCVLSCLVSCQDYSPDTHIPDGGLIYLSASVNENMLTRSPYYSSESASEGFSCPTTKHPLNVDVWGSTDAYTFKHIEEGGKVLDGSGENGKVSIHTDACFTSGQPQLLRAAIYSKTTKPDVYFVSFHPMSQDGEKWTDNAGVSASYTFNGNDDVMFAPQVSGKYAQDYEASPVLSFHHLLTWLRVEIKAESKEVSDSWGKITGMKITSKNTVKIDLSASAYDSDGSYKFEDSIQYSGEAKFNFYSTVEEESYVGSQVTLEKKFTDDVFPGSEGAEIPYLQSEELAYVLCAPVDAEETMVSDGKDVPAPEYYIEITTEKRSVTVPVDLLKAENEPFLGSTRCYQFNLRLNFKMGNTVYVTTSISDWQVGGIIFGELGDSDLNKRCI